MIAFPRSVAERSFLATTERTVTNAESAPAVYRESRKQSRALPTGATYLVSRRPPCGTAASTVIACVNGA
jgi:hypothetical protein